MTDVLDLFAGPGGWEARTRDLVRPIGVELDGAACATRAAAGHLTIRADVSTIATEPIRDLKGLIASPPCPTFSLSGNGAGVDELPHLIDHVLACADRWRPYTPPATLGFDDEHGEPIPPDPRSALVLEPLRFALECSPAWVALEQVPEVLPVWEAIADVLTRRGYSAWTGVLNAADYGIPQTRRRAILMAHRSRPVSPPAPTHGAHGPDLFGELAPWVTFAEVLGHDAILDRRQTGAPVLRASERPAPTLTTTAFGCSVWTITDDAGRRVPPTIDLALAVQSFPTGYPVTGTPRVAHAQIGNAIPPLLARRILEVLT